MNDAPLLARDHLATDGLALSQAIAQDVGPATMMAAVLYRLGGGSFAAMNRLRDVGCLPGPSTRTARRYLEALARHEFVDRIGRERIRKGSPIIRRTVTWRMTRKGLDAKEPFLVVPRWAVRLLVGRWADVAVLGVVVSETLLLRSVAENGTGTAYDYLEFSISRAARKTGLDRKTVRTTLDRLLARGILEYDPDDTEDQPDVHLHAQLVIPPGFMPPTIETILSPQERMGKSVTVTSNRRVEKLSQWVGNSVTDPWGNLSHTLGNSVHRIDKELDKELGLRTGIRNGVAAGDTASSGFSKASQEAEAKEPEPKPAEDPEANRAAALAWLRQQPDSPQSLTGGSA